MKDTKIREEIFQDIDAVRAINGKALGQPQEANLNNAFMMLWFDKTMINHVSGVAKYRDEFNEAT